jgi:hypothetical protein
MTPGVADWLRNGFGPRAGFTVFVAEAGDAATVIGMATAQAAPRIVPCSRHVSPAE